MEEMNSSACAAAQVLCECIRECLEVQVYLNLYLLPMGHELIQFNTFECYFKPFASNVVLLYNNIQAKYRQPSL